MSILPRGIVGLLNRAVFGKLGGEVSEGDPSSESLVVMTEGMIRFLRRERLPTDDDSEPVRLGDVSSDGNPYVNESNSPHQRPCVYWNAC